MELMSSSGGSECVDESEGITYQFAHILHAAGDHGRNIPAGVEILKATEAGVLVCEGRAHPRLHVAHLELESVRLQVLQLRQGSSNLVRGVPEIPNTILQRRFFILHGASGFEAGSPDGNVASIKQADFHGRIHEITLLRLEKPPIGRERRNAELRIASHVARSFNEFRDIRVGIGQGIFHFLPCS